LELPAFLHRVQAVHEAVQVDYSMPGCPPEPEQIIAVVRHVASGAPMPPAGSMIGCSDRAVCDECPREKRNKLAKQLLRPFEAIPEPGWCLVEQGFSCLGSTTRGGCLGLCPSANMPCTSCYGPLDRTSDPGATALATLAAAVDPGSTSGMSGTALHDRLTVALSGVADPLGTFYRYTLAETVVADRPAEVEQ
jgi:F420-non-reducing hydrogenase small subunit